MEKTKSTQYLYLSKNIFYIPKDEYDIVKKSLDKSLVEECQMLSENKIENFMFKDSNNVYVPDSHMAFINLKGKTGSKLA